MTFTLLYSYYNTIDSNFFICSPISGLFHIAEPTTSRLTPAFVSKKALSIDNECELAEISLATAKGITK